MFIVFKNGKQKQQNFKFQFCIIASLNVLLLKKCLCLFHVVSLMIKVHVESFFSLILCVNDFLCCYFESEALNINNKQGMAESDNNNGCRIVKGRRKSAVGKWEDKPLIRVETYKNFSSVCIYSKAYHYVFVTLLSFFLARFASHFNWEFEK